MRVLEKLQSRQAERHALDEARRDIKQLDEIATRRAAAKEASWAG